MTDINARLKWQYQTLDSVCGQMPKVTRDNTFHRLPKPIRVELEQAVAGQHIDSLSIDVTPPIVLHTGMESLLIYHSRTQSMAAYAGITIFKKRSQAQKHKRGP